MEKTGPLLDQDLRKWEFKNVIKCFDGVWIFQVLQDISSGKLCDTMLTAFRVDDHTTPLVLPIYKYVINLNSEKFFLFPSFKYYFALP